MALSKSIKMPNKVTVANMDPGGFQYPIKVLIQNTNITEPIMIYISDTVTGVHCYWH